MVLSPYPVTMYSVSANPIDIEAIIPCNLPNPYWEPQLTWQNLHKMVMLTLCKSLQLPAENSIWFLNLPTRWDMDMNFRSRVKCDKIPAEGIKFNIFTAAGYILCVGTYSTEIAARWHWCRCLKHETNLLPSQNSDSSCFHRTLQ